MPNDVIIIGGGLAGLACAIRLTRPGSPRSLRVLLLEKNDIPGKKLLISGTGQCNITHAGPIEDFLARYGPPEKGRFVKPALYQYPNSDLVEFFRNRGLEMIETEEGKLFPETRKSKDVLRILLDCCNDQSVRIATKSDVRSIERTESGFVVRTNELAYSAQAVVIASGGQSYPATGSSGDGYRFAAELGHTILPPAPALTPIYAPGSPLVDCSGIAISGAGITLLDSAGRKTNRKTQRDVLLTHRGFSGPGILDFSRYLSRGDRLLFNWLGDENEERCEKRLRAALAENGSRSLKTAVFGFGLPKRFVVALLRAIGVDPDTPGSSLEKTARRKVVAALCAFEVRIESLGGFSEAMVTRGGVALAEVNRNTLESRRVPDLYFCGEVLDIDGDTGGYNLQFA